MRQRRGLGAAIDRFLTSSTDLAAARAGADALGTHLTWDRLVPHYLEVFTEASRVTGAAPARKPLGTLVRGGRTPLYSRAA